MHITKIRWSQRKKDRVLIDIDGAFGLSISADLLLKEGLKVGDEISEERIETIGQYGRSEAARDKALNYLSYRPHSQKELGEKLKRAGFSEDQADEAIRFANERAYQSDEEYANAMVRHLISKKYSNRRILQELAFKGIESELAKTALAPYIDEEERIFACMQKKTKTGGIKNKEEKNKLVQSLLRMGYAYDVIASALPQIAEDEML